MNQHVGLDKDTTSSRLYGFRNYGQAAGKLQILHDTLFRYSALTGNDV